MLKIFANVIAAVAIAVLGFSLLGSAVSPQTPQLKIIATVVAHAHSRNISSSSASITSRMLFN